MYIMEQYNVKAYYRSPGEYILTSVQPIGFIVLAFFSYENIYVLHVNNKKCTVVMIFVSSEKIQIKSSQLLQSAV